MRVALERLDSRSLEVTLQGAQRVAVRSAEALSGTFESEGARLHIENLRAERLALDALHLVFGSVALTTSEGAAFAGVGAEITNDPDALVLAIDAQTASAPALAVELEGFRLRGKVSFTKLRIAVTGGEGRIEAARVDLSGVSVHVGGVEIVADALSGEGLAMGWGEEGFRFDAKRLEGPALRVGAGAAQIEASALRAHDVAVRGSEVAVSRATVATGSLSVAFAPAPERSSAPPRPSAAPPLPRASAAPPPAAGLPLFDWRVLDGISGDLRVDLALDLTVPILGRRRATHRFRVPLEDGTLDFMRLENDLATLENTLLDFAVRDGALVLERGIPLLPTRGRGKPIVWWNLGPDDLALAARQRVRLAVLPYVYVASEPSEGSEEGSRSSVALRQLSLLDLEARLALAPVGAKGTAQLLPLRIGSVVVEGNVFHDVTSPPREGLLRGTLGELEASVAQLPLGREVLDVARLRLARISALEAAFLDVRPTALRLSLDGLELEGVRFGPPPERPH
jgi:hypothetical protein